MVDATLCLIDGHSLFYRAFYAIRAPLTTSSGQPTNAVFGFVKMMRRILQDVHPEYLAVCSDAGKVTHRTEKFAAYKEQRQPMPEGLVSQMPLIKDVIRAYDYALFEKEGFEADDLIATLVRAAKKKFRRVVVVSSDKDILQLVDDRVQVYNPYKEDGIVFTPALVRERMGVTPDRIRELIALMGDASDNIPGAHGIGEKTALTLLEEFHDCEDLIKNSARIRRESVRLLVQEHADDIRLSRDLATLRADVPIDVAFADLKLKPPDVKKLWAVFMRLEFKAFLKELAEERLSSPGADDPVSVPARAIGDPAAFLARVRDGGSFSFFLNVQEGAGWNANIALDAEAVATTDDAGFLKSLFELPSVAAIGYDVKECRHFLKRLGIVPRVAFYDVMLAAYCLTSSRGTLELESLLWNYLDLKGISRPQYLGKEALYLWRLKNVLSAELKQRGLTDLFDKVEMPLNEVLFEMESTGVAIDTGALKALAQTLDQKLDKLVTHIFEAAGSPFNINSPKQLAEVLFHKLKLPVIKKTKTGISTDEEVLTRLSRDYELPRHLLIYRQTAKLKSTYVDVLPGLVHPSTGKLHTTLHQIGTETGRLSSSNPNLQNIPVKGEMGGKIRQAFIPSGGFDALLSADYSQIELRVLAHLSGDDALAQAFRSDADIHRHTASLIFGVEEKDVTDLMRTNAKRVNFGIIYGMSPYGLAKDLGIDPKTAETFIEEYFLRYPMVRAYLEGRIAFVREHGYVATILGRRRYIPEINAGNAAMRQFAERQAINAPIQGSAADLIKMAMIRIAAEIRSARLTSRLLLQVHDELIFEVVRKEQASLAALVRDRMEKVFSLSVPLKVTVRVGPNWWDTQELS